jgi:hypothetical protein
MSNVENNFSISIYPYGYNELVKERDLQESQALEERRREQLADELAIPLGALALGALTGGIASPEYKDSPATQPSTEQIRKLGAISVSDLISVDHPSFMNSLENERAAAINERAVLGYADQRAYNLAA